LCPQHGEILLRGMVVIPEDKSLSEGATQARLVRDSFDQFARDLAFVQDKTEGRVDYRPLARILDELQTLTVDMLLGQWAGPVEVTGGITTDDILQHAPCDVVLVSGAIAQHHRPVLLSLRGGPNMSLGLRVARTLASNSTITLFHASGTPRTT